MKCYLELIPAFGVSVGRSALDPLTGVVSPTKCAGCSRRIIEISRAQARCSRTARKMLAVPLPGTQIGSLPASASLTQ